MVLSTLSGIDKDVESSPGLEPVSPCHSAYRGTHVHMLLRPTASGTTNLSTQTRPGQAQLVNHFVCHWLIHLPQRKGKKMQLRRKRNPPRGSPKSDEHANLNDKETGSCHDYSSQHPHLCDTNCGTNPSVATAALRPGLHGLIFTSASAGAASARGSQLSA